MELADALRHAGGWRKSTRSTGENTCVAVTTALPGVVGVRDTKGPDTAPLLAFPDAAWAGFLSDLR